MQIYANEDGDICLLPPFSLSLSLSIWFLVHHQQEFETGRILMREVSLIRHFSFCAVKSASG